MNLNFSAPKTERSQSDTFKVHFRPLQNKEANMAEVDILTLSTQLESDQDNEGELSERWTEELLANEIRKYPCIWDTTSRSYKDGCMKQQAWRAVCTQLGAPEDLLKKTWKNLKDGLSKCLKKRDLMQRSGAAAGKLPKCKLFEQLLFIRDTVTNRPTTSNVIMEGSANTSTSAEPETFVQAETPSSVEDSTRPKKMRKRDLNECDALLIEALKKDVSKQESKIDADISFAESIVPILQKLPTRKNRLAKVQIQQLLLNLEFGEDSV